MELVLQLQVDLPLGTFSSAEIVVDVSTIQVNGVTQDSPCRPRDSRCLNPVRRINLSWFGMGMVENLLLADGALPYLVEWQVPLAMSPGENSITWDYSTTSLLGIRVHPGGVASGGWMHGERAAQVPGYRRVPTPL